MTPHEYALLTRTDLITLVEQRPWIAAELRDENNRNRMTTLGDVLRGRREISRRQVVRWERRHKYMPQPPRYVDPHPEHGVLCDCDDCNEAVKRLLIDCGVLPKGKA